MQSRANLQEARIKLPRTCPNIDYPLFSAHFMNKNTRLHLASLGIALLVCTSATASSVNTPSQKVPPLTFLDSAALMNDLDGQLQGTVKFVQTHTIDASGNSKNEMPRLVGSRSTLAMLIPQDTSVQSVTVTGHDKNGRLLGQIDMASPDKLPLTDNPNPPSAEKPDVIYAANAWSTVLPWNWMKPGLTLSFADNQQRSGELTTIDIGADSQAVYQNIQIGMLTPPDPKVDNIFANDKAAAEDYFQKLPVSQIVVGNYESLTLRKVVLSNGTVYDHASLDTGSDFYGDLREDIGKGLISIGIDNANFGINSSQGDAQWQPGLFPVFAVHQSWGNYSNGVVQHGLSGGNGMATLMDTYGNEFSHELGHAYGMGHYPGEILSVHGLNSGWGWDAKQNRFISNFYWDWDGEACYGDICVAPFAGKYEFNKDTMGDGYALSSISLYTHHTGYTQKRMQHFFETTGMISENSSTGYLMWDETKKAMVEKAGEWRRKPVEFGVPVTTLVGYYDPQKKKTSYIYPAMHGSYGHVYAPKKITAGQCVAEVNYGSGTSEKFGLDGTRLSPDTMNKFHINVSAERNPTDVTVSCPEVDMEEIFSTWKLDKFNVSRFENWDENNYTGNVGDLYFDSENGRYFRLKTPSFGYFPTDEKDNDYWTFVTKESDLKREFDAILAEEDATDILLEPLDSNTITPANGTLHAPFIIGNLQGNSEDILDTPEAVVGADIAHAVAPTNGTISFPLDGSKSKGAVKYEWEQLSGSVALIDADRAVATMSAKKNDAGENTYQLTVTSKSGKQSRAIINVTVVAPVVEISGATTILEGRKSSLKAQANFDGKYSWKVLTAAGNEVMQGAQQELNLSTLTAGDYQITASVESQHGERHVSAQQYLTVKKPAENGPPTIVVDGPAHATAGTLVTLDASGSSAANGGTLSYSWKVWPQLPFDTDGAQLTFTAPELTRRVEYLFTVSANDGNLSNQKYHFVIVEAHATAPARH